MGYSKETERQNKVLGDLLAGREPEKRIMVGYNEPKEKKKDKEGPSLILGDTTIKSLVSRIYLDIKLDLDLIIVAYQACIITKVEVSINIL